MTHQTHRRRAPDTGRGRPRVHRALDCPTTRRAPSAAPGRYNHRPVPLRPPTVAALFNLACRSPGTVGFFETKRRGHSPAPVPWLLDTHSLPDHPVPGELRDPT